MMREEDIINRLDSALINIKQLLRIQYPFVLENEKDINLAYNTLLRISLSLQISREEVSINKKKVSLNRITELLK